MFQLLQKIEIGPFAITRGIPTGLRAGVFNV